MGKPIGYNPARLQRAYLPVPGIELILMIDQFFHAGLREKIFHLQHGTVFTAGEADERLRHSG